LGAGSTDDAEAVARTLAGDRDAYAVLVVRYTALAHRTAYLFGAGDQADDVVQEAFVRAFGALESFRHSGAFKPWLLRIVVNQALNLRRSGRRDQGRVLRAVALGVAAEPVDPQDVAIASDERAALLAAVRALPERDRLVLTCRYFLELSESETAQVLGLPQGTIKSRQSRALKKLRPALEAQRDKETADD
jgi:RNA polymerase sigma-70 factor (ECF subfamily)